MIKAMDVYSRSTLFTTIYYLFLAVFVTFKNNTMVLVFFFLFALPLLKHVIHISYILTVILKGVGCSISVAVETEVLWLYVTWKNTQS